jgi:hypothetical protein
LDGESLIGLRLGTTCLLGFLFFLVLLGQFGIFGEQLGSCGVGAAVEGLDETLDVLLVVPLVGRLLGFLEKEPGVPNFGDQVLHALETISGRFAHQSQYQPIKFGGDIVVEERGWWWLGCQVPLEQVGG